MDKGTPRSTQGLGSIKEAKRNKDHLSLHIQIVFITWI